MKRNTTMIPVVVLAAVIGGLIAWAIGGNSKTIHSTTTVVKPSGSASSSVPTSFSGSQKGLSINQIYRMDSPGVVDIIEIGSSSGSGLFGGGKQEGEGAGVVYDSKGDILTDEHVVAGAQLVTVHFQDGLTARAKVLGTDPSTDVAVIKVNVPAAQLHPITFADSSAAQVGDPVVAIGSPFSLPETVTQGIVSAIGRSIEAPNNYQITGAIQTDAAINPGNSGGPLLAADGRVLGLSDQIETNNQTVSGQGSSSGVGFATPGNEDQKIANAIIAGHPIKHPFVGVELNGASSGGAAITLVEPNTPAVRAGLRNGDVITAINGGKITSTQQFINTIDNFKPGQTVTLSVRRGGRSSTLKLTLGVRPASSPTTG